MNFLTIACIVCLLGSVCSGLYSLKNVYGAKIIEGTVVEIERQSTNSRGRSSRTSQPIVEYARPSGQTAKIKTKAASFNCAIGNKVYVAYKETQNHKVKEVVLSMGELLLFPGLLGFFGFILLLIAMPFEKSSHLMTSFLTLLGLVHK
jgi:hypothetical protein